MSYNPVIPAPANTPCGYATGCRTGRDAVHVLTDTIPAGTAGTALCGFHSPCDVTPESVAPTAVSVRVIRALTAEPVRPLRWDVRLTNPDTAERDVNTFTWAPTRTEAVKRVNEEIVSHPALWLGWCAIVADRGRIVL